MKNAHGANVMAAVTETPALKPLAKNLGRPVGALSRRAPEPRQGASPLYPLNFFI
jgi:hypothetical protein